MKGKTACPKCNHDFVIDVPDDAEKHTAKCPECNHEFVIKCSADNGCEEWEEHGEPRKTVLSALKTKTNRPIIASFLLLTVCVLGVFNAVFELNSSEIFPYFSVIYEFLDYLQFAVIIIIFSVCAGIGSILSFMRKYYRVTVLTAFLGVFSFGFIVGLILSVAALVLVFQSRDEFENGTKGKVF